MKITQSELRKIIKEELKKSLKLDEASGSNRTVVKPTGDQAPFGLGSNALRAIAQFYSDNLSDKTIHGLANTAQSLVSGLASLTGHDSEKIRANWSTVLNDENKLTQLQLKIDPFVKKGFTKGEDFENRVVPYKTKMANAGLSKSRGGVTVGQTRQTSLGQGDKFMNLAENVDNQELQQKFQAFLKTPEGKKTQQLAMKAKQKLNKPTGAVKESLGDIDASLTATGVFLGPFLAYLAQQGMGVSPNLEDNVIGFLAGVAGGAALGAGLDYLRRDKKDTESEVPSAGSARWKTDPRARRY